MKAREIQAGDYFANAIAPYVVERVITANEVDGVHVLVRYVQDGGTDIRVFEYDQHVHLAPGSSTVR